MPVLPSLSKLQAIRLIFEFGKIAKAEGLRYVGGCCGCNAAYLRALADGLAEAK